VKLTFPLNYGNVAFLREEDKGGTSLCNYRVSTGEVLTCVDSDQSKKYPGFGPLNYQTGVVINGNSHFSLALVEQLDPGHAQVDLYLLEASGVLKKTGSIYFHQVLGVDPFILKYRNGLLIILCSFFEGWDVSSPEPKKVFTSYYGSMQEVEFVSEDLLVTTAPKLEMQVWNIWRQTEEEEGTKYLSPIRSLKRSYCDHITRVVALREGCFVVNSPTATHSIWDLSSQNDEWSQANNLRIYYPIIGYYPLKLNPEEFICSGYNDGPGFSVYNVQNKELVCKLKGFEPKGPYFLLPSPKRNEKVLRCVLSRRLERQLPKDLVGEVFSFLGSCFRIE